MGFIDISDEIPQTHCIVVSCWDKTDRLTLLMPSNLTLAETIEPCQNLFLAQYKRPPKYLSVHEVSHLTSKQGIGIALDK